MAMKSLVEGDCGRPNALVGLARNSAQGGSSRIAASVRSTQTPLSSTFGDALAHEYLVEAAQSSVVPSTFNMVELARHLPAQTSTTTARNWSEEYTGAVASQWAHQYTHSNTAAFEGAWNSAQTNNSSHLNQISSPLMWSSEYLENFDQQSNEPSGVARGWAAEFLQTREQLAHADSDAFLSKLQSDWESQQRSSSAMSFDAPSLEEYEMEDNNPYLNEENLMEKGSSLLMSGDLANSILHFEAAIHRNPNDSQAWCLLGLSQAENEQDTRAISAFKKALEIDPKNKEALLALSVSYANESLENDALCQLERWLDVHPEYGSGLTSLQTAPIVSSFLDQSKFSTVEARFLEAAQKQPPGGDAQLQNALGVLYNLNRNFDRAVDSIKAAIAIRPDDSRLWNRLGATLANGDRTPEAIAAYRQALSLFPTYVRARYNLGISCMHLSSYNEAIDHFVSALELQQGADPGGASSIWQTVRSAVIRSQSANTDALLAAVEARDLRSLVALLRTQ